jgi:hypothetical protein
MRPSIRKTDRETLFQFPVPLLLAGLIDDELDISRESRHGCDSYQTPRDAAQGSLHGRLLQFGPADDGMVAWQDRTSSPVGRHRYIITYFNDML